MVPESQIYTRLGGTNMIQTNNGCQGRQIIETTAARGGDHKNTAARGFDTSAGIVTVITDWYYGDWYYCDWFFYALVTVTGMAGMTGVILKRHMWRHTDIQTGWYAGIIDE